MTTSIKNTLTLDGVEYIRKDSVKEQAEVNKDGLTYSIVRTYSAWVWAGWIKFPCEAWEIVYDARRLWKWDSIFTLSELANNWVRKAIDCKFAEEVDRVWLTEVIEVIPCTETAKNSIQSVVNHKP